MRKSLIYQGFPRLEQFELSLNNQDKVETIHETAKTLILTLYSEREKTKLQTLK